MEQEQEKLSDKLALKRTDLADSRTSLAVKRNIMAAERTIMAWTRTGLSMIGFGFTIYKFLQYLQGEGKQLAANPQHPVRIGLFLLFLGTISLLVGAVQHWKSMKDLSRQFECSPWSFSFISTLLIALLGLMLIVSIIGNLNLL